MAEGFRGPFPFRYSLDQPGAPYPYAGRKFFAGIFEGQRYGEIEGIGYLGIGY